MGGERQSIEESGEIMREGKEIVGEKEIKTFEISFTQQYSACVYLHQHNS